MNGQKIFERLSSMTEEQRKSCQFWWISDKRTIDNFMDGLRTDYKEINNTLWEKIENELSANDILQINEDTEEELNEMEAFDGIWDDYVGIIHNKLEDYIREKAEKNGVKIEWQH